MFTARLSNTYNLIEVVHHVNNISQNSEIIMPNIVVDNNQHHHNRKVYITQHLLPAEEFCYAF